MEEAILYGLFELVERDAVSIWWYNKGRYPRFDFTGYNDPYLDLVCSYLESVGRALWVLDLTHDLGIPTFAAVSPKVNGGPEEILMGFGTHFDARTAVTRAILEVNQSLPAATKSPAQRRMQLLPDFADVLHWWETATIEEENYLVPDPSSKATTIDTYGEVDSIELNGLLERYVQRLQLVGLELIVLDLTRP